MTTDDVRAQFLGHVESMIDYWRSVEIQPVAGHSSDGTTRRLEGLAHSILATIDGESGDMPAFALVPYPDGMTPPTCQGNIAGDLHNALSHRN